MSVPQLQYRLIDQLGPPFYCDPAVYPVAREQDPAAASQQVVVLRSQHPDEFNAIVAHQHLDGANLSDADNLLIVRQAAELSAVPLTADGAVYDFNYQVAGSPLTDVKGTITHGGVITVTSRTPGVRHMCPLIGGPPPQ